MQKHCGAPATRNVLPSAAHEGLLWHAGALRCCSNVECGSGDSVPAAQGRFRMIKRTEGVSSTDIVGRMLMCTRDNARFREARPAPLAYRGRLGA